MGILLLLFSFNFTFAATADSYKGENRISYLENAMKALKGAQRQGLQDTRRYIDLLQSNVCRASSPDLKLSCLLSQGKTYCGEQRDPNAKSGCQYYFDIMLINSLSQQSFLSKRERYAMMKKSGSSYEDSLQQALDHRYGALAAEFALSSHYECSDDQELCLATGVESFCSQVSKEGRMTWQTCVGALIWLIGTS